MVEYEELKVELMMEKIFVKIYVYDLLLFDFEDDKFLVLLLKLKIYCFFGREKFVYKVFGGGKCMYFFFWNFVFCLFLFLDCYGELFEIVFVFLCICGEILFVDLDFIVFCYFGKIGIDSRFFCEIYLIIIFFL